MLGKDQKCLECSETQEYAKKSEIFVRVSTKLYLEIMLLSIFPSQPDIYLLQYNLLKGISRLNKKSTYFYHGIIYV